MNQEPSPGEDDATGRGEESECAVTDAAQQQIEAEEARVAKAMDRRRLFELKQSTFDDAEEVCVWVCLDLVDGMFEEMQTFDENLKSFAVAARIATQQVFEAGFLTAMTSELPFDMLDSHDTSQFGSSTTRQQVLKTSGSDAGVNIKQTTYNGLAISDRVDVPMTFLRRILRFMENHHDEAEQVLRWMDGASFSARSKRIAGTVIGIPGASLEEWGIPPGLLSRYLEELIDTHHLSILPSAIHFICESNKAVLEKACKTHGRLTFSKIQNCVQRALITAQEEVDESAKTHDRRLFEKHDVEEDGYLSVDNIFQTEVPPTACQKGRAEKIDRSIEKKDKRMLACYKNEPEPVPSLIDRNAPGSLVKKPNIGALSPKTRLARKVMTALWATPHSNSHWGSLKKQVLDHNQLVANSPPQPKRNSHFVSPSRPAKKASMTSISRKSTKDSEKANGRLPLTVNDPDTATLSNIFALGTPRQLSATELARRNDILAILERAEDQKQRKMAHATIGAVVKEGLSDQDPAFQNYVNAYSSIIVGISGEHSLSGNGVGNTKRLERKKCAGIHSKFELVAPPFTISEGNTHARNAQDAMQMSMCSPIKQPEDDKSTTLEKGRATIASLDNNSSDSVYQSLSTYTSSSSTSHLPQLNTSQLAVDVRAVVCGVEKHGRKKKPSRKSRLRLHNYSASLKEMNDDDQDEADYQTSQVRPAATSSLSSSPVPQSHLPLILPVSPIKASPHRKCVTFKGGKAIAKRKHEPTFNLPPNLSPMSPLHMRRQVIAKQPVWNEKISPPRVRNRHFATGMHHRRVIPSHTKDDQHAQSDEDENDQEDMNMSKIFSLWYTRRNGFYKHLLASSNVCFVLVFCRINVEINESSTEKYPFILSKR